MIRRPLAATLLVALAAFVAVPCAFADPDENILAALAVQPRALPDMVLGDAKAPVTMVEYSSMTCPHCAAFEQNVLPMLRSKYVDTGKVRFISREFPLELKAMAASMLARCIAHDDSPKYFEAMAMLFQQQQPLVENTIATMNAVGSRFSMDAASVEACVKDQALLDKLSADQQFAAQQMKVDATPTFFINGERIKGALSFEEFANKLDAHLKR